MRCRLVMSLANTVALPAWKVYFWPIALILVVSAAKQSARQQPFAPPAHRQVAQMALHGALRQAAEGAALALQ